MKKVIIDIDKVKSEIHNQYHLHGSIDAEEALDAIEEYIEKNSIPYFGYMEEEPNCCKECEYFPGDGCLCLMKGITVTKDTLACEELNIPH